MSEAIHQEVVFAAPRERIYELLLDAQQFSAMSGGAPTRIAQEAGGDFSCFGGMIEGRQVELLPAERIVQAWRVKTWPQGRYSLVRFELKSEAGGTRLVLEQLGHPAEEHAHLSAGWEANYWAPLRKQLA